MDTYRPRIAASLALLAVVLAFFAGSLLRPDPAGAARNTSLRFLFGPVAALKGDNVSFSYFNTGTRPSPPATVVFRNALTGDQLESFPLTAVDPGQGTAVDFFQSPATGVILVAIVTFNRPAADQAIPRPFPGTVQIVDVGAERVQAVVDPIQR